MMTPRVGFTLMLICAVVCDYCAYLLARDVSAALAVVPFLLALACAYVGYLWLKRGATPDDDAQ